jgi:hypothetical protein
MKGPLLFVIFAVVCAYAHAQCCVGDFTTMDGKDPVQWSLFEKLTEFEFKAKDETACKAACGAWIPTCTAGESCMIMACTGKQGTTAFKRMTPMCSSAGSQHITYVWQEALTAAGATEVECDSGFWPGTVIFDAPTIPATQCYFGWCAQAEAAVTLDRGTCE